MQKGQLSLEMVVGLIILLVVAGVVISLVLGFIKPETFLKSTRRAKIEEFKSFCKGLCQSDVLEYCRSYYGMNEGENDWNGNNKKYELIKVGPYQWYTCEDRVYCFLIEPCELLGENPIRGCKELLCQSFLEKYEGNVEWANEALLETIQFSTKCNLDRIPADEKEREDWYTRYFKSGCGE